MTSLEEKINNLQLLPHLTPIGINICTLGQLHAIEKWSIDHHVKVKASSFDDMVYILEDTRMGSAGKIVSSMKGQVNKIIEEASIAVCLTSPSEYIREYKRIWIAKENKKS